MKHMDKVLETLGSRINELENLLFAREYQVEQLEKKNAELNERLGEGWQK